MDLQPLGIFGTTNPPIPSLFPVLKLGNTQWVGKVGVALGGSLVALQQLCPSRSASVVELQGFPWSVAGLGDGGGLSSSPAAAILELLFKALRIPGKTNPE